MTLAPSIKEKIVRLLQSHITALGTKPEVASVEYDHTCNSSFLIAVSAVRLCTLFYEGLRSGSRGSFRYLEHRRKVRCDCLVIAII